MDIDRSRLIDMAQFDLDTEFIAEVSLPRTASAYPHIRYADGENVHRQLFSRVGWFPTTSGNAPRCIYVLFVGTAESIEKHGPAIADVRARGNDLMVFEFAGQGASGRFLADERKVHAMPGGFDMWVDSLKEFLCSALFRAARQRGYDHDIECVALPYSLGGHMFGRLMQEAPEFSRRFSRIVYVNPVVAINSAGSMVNRIGQQVLVRWKVVKAGQTDAFLPGHGRFHPGDRPLQKSSIGSDLPRHEWICRFYHDNPHLTMWGMTFGWFDEANRSLGKLWDTIIEGEVNAPFFRLWGKVRKEPVQPKHRARVPALVVSSQRDTIVVARYVQRFAKYIGADLLYLPNAKHEPSQEPPQIREGTFDAVAAWVANPEHPDIAETPHIRFIPRR